MNATLLITVACLGGIAIAVQAQFVGALDRSVGTFGSVFVTYAGGGAVIFLAMLIARRGSFQELQAVPLHLWSAGLLGLVIIGSIGYSVPGLGLVSALTILIVSQIAAGVLIDHFGLFGATVRLVDTTRLVGLAVLSLGAWLVLK